jgi:serine/threonine protein kinase
MQQQPPEVLEGRVGYEGAPADVWCAGVVLFLLLLGHPPFAMANRDDWWYRAYTTGRTKAFWDSHLQVSLWQLLAVTPSAVSV